MSLENANKGEGTPFIQKDMEKIVRPLSEMNNNIGVPSALSMSEEQKEAINKSFMPNIKRIPLKDFEIPDLMTPLKDRVLIALIEVKPKEESKIINPSTNRPVYSGSFDEHPFQGLVIAVGPGHVSEPITDIKKGDIVFLENMPGKLELNNMYIHEGYWYIITRYSHIVGKASKDFVDKSVDKNIVLEKMNLSHE